MPPNYESAKGQFCARRESSKTVFFHLFEEVCCVPSMELGLSVLAPGTIPLMMQTFRGQKEGKRWVSFDGLISQCEAEINLKADEP